MIYRAAFAVNEENEFEKSHFGDAKKFILYEWQHGYFKHVSELKNTARDTDEETEHGSQKRGKQIVSELKSHGVEVLVAKQFGKNIKIVKQHFVPVVISVNMPDDACMLLTENYAKLAEQLQLLKSGENKMINLRN